MRLPTEMSEPETLSLSEVVWILYGARKIGKTSLASQFPDNLLICAEPGARGIRCFRIEIGTWEEFAEVVREVGGSNFRTVTIDTADALWEMCLGYVCRREGVRNPNDRPYGEIWSLAEKEWVGKIKELVLTGRGLIVISHTEVSDLLLAGRERTTRIEPSIPKTAKRFLLAIADIIAFYGYEGEQRVLYLRGSTSLEAGMRYPFFTDEGGEPAEKIAMGESAEEAYRNLLSHLNPSLRAGGGGKKIRKIGGGG